MVSHGATGLNLAVYRAYEPEGGRWASQDPIGLAGGLNLYRYVENDPVNGTDPLGLLCINWTQAAGALLLGIGFAVLMAVAFSPLIFAIAALPALGVPVGIMLAIKTGLFIGGLVGAGIGAATAYYQLKAGCTNEAFFTVGTILGSWLVGLSLWGSPNLGNKPNIRFQAQLTQPAVPAGTRSAHNQAANQMLQNAMNNPFTALKNALNGVKLPSNSSASPPGWTWHHAQQPGNMQLVLRSQHQSRFWSVLHPGGKGGFFLWGHLF